MATREQIEATYNYMDEIFRLTFGECADISGAMYNGDFSKSLEEAQQAKREYVLRNLNIQSGSRLLDVGCGWGPILRSVQSRGGRGVGLTLSTKQAEACRRNGLEVYVLDWKDRRVHELGQFDGIVSIGSFEHFCSREDYYAGQQEAIYRSFFKLCHELLVPGGRVYVQTMTRGKNAPNYEEVSVRAPRGSDAYLLAVVEKFYPGSWPPSGIEQLGTVASPYFRLLFSNSGREDYIETMTQWEKRIYKPSVTKLIKAIKLLRYLMVDKDFLYKLEELIGSYNKACFQRQLLDHYRIVFEKTS